MTKKLTPLLEPAENRAGGQTANRTHKSRLFLSLFSRQEELLDLYNAINDSHYTDPDMLEINTLEDVLYLGMKNDISFLIGSDMNLYEHQSTDNPNMPLRGLFYFARLYQGYVSSRNLDIYSHTQLRLPTPRYIVFYNGKKDIPERIQLYLSTSFEKAEEGPLFAGEPPSLECTATVLNINYGRNKKIMEGCRRLQEYAYLVHRIRFHLDQNLDLAEAVDIAIDDCLRDGVLTEYLTKHRSEVTMSILTEYDEEKQLRYAFRDGRATGLEEGKVRMRLLLVCRKLSKGKMLEQMAEELDEDIAVIRPLYEAALPFAPDFDVDRIYEVLDTN